MSAYEKAEFPQFDITVDDSIRYRGRYWSMSRRRGGLIEFIDPRANELLSLTDEELAGLIGAFEAKILRGDVSLKDERYATATSDLAVIRTADIEDGRRSLAYVDELQRRGLIYRPAKKDVKEVIQTVAAKIGDPQPPAPYLVKRWLKKAVKRAAAGGRTADQLTVGDLVPQHGFKGNRTSRICFEVSKIIDQQIRKVFLTRERRSVESLLATVRTKVRENNKLRAPDDQLKIPGLTAIMSAIRGFPRGEVITARYGADAAYNKLGPVEYRPRPLHPLDEVEIDHTTCDLFVVDGITGAPLGRPTIALGSDRCTAMPWGIHIGFDPPSVHTVMQCIRNGMFPKNYVRIYADAGIWDIKGCSPVFGRPVKISVDRGAENINNDMKALGVDLPIKEIEAKRGRKGRYKGGIERMLGTLNRTLLHEQRGTTFSNIIDRDDYDPKKNAVITYEELLEKVHAWSIDIYMRRRHNGIKDVPLRLWNEKIVNHRPAQLENAEKILPLFGRIEHRILRRDGIRWKHLFFTSPELMALLSNPAFIKASTNQKGNIVVRFRYDASNIDHIHVYLPHARDQETMHLCVPVEKRAREYARGLSVWAHDAIIGIARKKADDAVDLEALDLARTKLLEDMEAETPGSAKVRGRKRIARIRQIGGLAPYGDSIRTTPHGSFEDIRQAAAVAADQGQRDEAGLPIIANDYGLVPITEIDPTEDEDEVDDVIARGEKPKQATRNYSRRSDPAVASARPSGTRSRAKGRKATPKVSASDDDGEIDFYGKYVAA